MQSFQLLAAEKAGEIRCFHVLVNICSLQELKVNSAINIFGVCAEIYAFHGAAMEVE